VPGGNQSHSPKTRQSLFNGEGWSDLDPSIPTGHDDLSFVRVVSPLAIRRCGPFEGHTVYEVTLGPRPHATTSGY